MEVTKQEIFDRVARHLLTQKQQARRIEKSNAPYATTESYCAYRTPEGLTCAIGCLIQPGGYDEKLEGNTIGQLIAATQEDEYNPEKERQDAEDRFFKAFGPEIGEFLVKNSHFATRLQNVHDCNEPDTWPKVLSEFAESWGLSDDVVKEFSSK